MTITIGNFSGKRGIKYYENTLTNPTDLRSTSNSIAGINIAHGSWVTDDTNNQASTATNWFGVFYQQTDETYALSTYSYDTSAHTHTKIAEDIHSYGGGGVGAGSACQIDNDYLVYAGFTGPSSGYPTYYPMQGGVHKFNNALTGFGTTGGQSFSIKSNDGGPYSSAKRLGSNSTAFFGGGTGASESGYWFTDYSGGGSSPNVCGNTEHGNFDEYYSSGGPHDYGYMSYLGKLSGVGGRGTAATYSNMAQQYKVMYINNAFSGQSITDWASQADHDGTTSPIGSEYAGAAGPINIIVWSWDGADGSAVYKEKFIRAITFPTRETDSGTAEVNGAISSSTALVIDNISGDIKKGQSIRGSGLVGSQEVSAWDANTNTVTLSGAGTVSDDVAVTFKNHSFFVPQLLLTTWGNVVIHSDSVTRENAKVYPITYSEGLADVNGSTSSSTTLAVDGNSGDDITVGATVTGSGILLSSSSPPSIGTAVVNGATSSSTALSVDGHAGETLVTGMYVTGTGISGTITVNTVTDQNTLVLSSAQTLSDGVTLTFKSPGAVTTVDVVTDQNNLVLSKTESLTNNNELRFSSVTVGDAIDWHDNSHNIFPHEVYLDRLDGAGSSACNKYECGSRRDNLDVYKTIRMYEDGGSTYIDFIEIDLSKVLSDSKFNVYTLHKKAYSFSKLDIEIKGAIHMKNDKDVLFLFGNVNASDDQEYRLVYFEGVF